MEMIGQTVLTCAAPLHTSATPALVAELQAQQLAQDAGHGPLGGLDGLHFARCVVLPEERAAEGERLPPCLVLSSLYDGPLDVHVRRLADRASGFLNAIFRHCRGFKPRQGRDALGAFLQRTMVPS